MGHLTSLIRRNRWEELEEWLVSRSPVSTNADLLVTEMNRVDRLGRNPLYYACAKKRAPVHIVKLMLDLAATTSSSSAAVPPSKKSSYVKRAPLVRTDICGNTLLHAAAACGNAQVVRVLLETFAHRGKTIRQINDVGMTPLMMAWRKHLDASFTLFGDGRSAGRMSPEVSENVQLLLQSSRTSDLEGMERLSDLWDKTCALTYRDANTKYPSRGQPKRLLHTLATVGGQQQVQCPTLVMWLAIRFNRDQLAQQDDEGNLPLHLASTHLELPTMPLFMKVLQPFIKHANSSIVLMMVKEYPAAASIMNRQGRIPLHLAIDQGKPWDGALLPLLRAAPQAMEQRDPITKLFPALQAAATRSCSLSIVFELLCRRPDILLLSHRGEDAAMDVA